MGTIISLVILGMITVFCGITLICLSVYVYSENKPSKKEYHVNLNGLNISSESHIKINSIDMHEQIEAIGSQEH